MNDWLTMPGFWMTAGYLLGSIPFGLLIARAGGAGDIRQIGSGNIGTTNVLRTGRKGLAALTLLLDAGKGATAVLVAEHFAPGSGILAGAAAFLGHLFPVWLGFKGGKGVATMLGVALAAVPVAGIAFAVVWVTTALLTRYSSLGGMLAAVAAPVTAVGAGHMGEATLLWAMAALVLWMHRENIARLRKGTETKIGQK
jgi:acyl phosphate:glycerol-3-phosphate acyltransferase